MYVDINEKRTAYSLKFNFYDNFYSKIITEACYYIYVGNHF